MVRVSKLYLWNYREYIGNSAESREYLWAINQRDLSTVTGDDRQV